MPPARPRFRGCGDAGSSPSPLPTPTEQGQILYAVTSASFVPASPLVVEPGYLLLTDDGRLVVRGTTP